MYTKVICTKYKYSNCHKYSNFHKTTKNWYSLVVSNTNKSLVINKTINILPSTAIIIKLALLNRNVTVTAKGFYGGTQETCRVPGDFKDLTL